MLYSPGTKVKINTFGISCLFCKEKFIKYSIYDQNLLKYTKLCLYDTWSPASLTLFSAYFSCSSGSVMPVYLQPICLTTSIAKPPHPHPMSRMSCFLSIRAFYLFIYHIITFIKILTKIWIKWKSKKLYSLFLLELRFSSSVPLSSLHTHPIAKILSNKERKKKNINQCYCILWKNKYHLYI